MVKYILVCGGVISYVNPFALEEDRLLIYPSGIGKGVIGEYRCLALSQSSSHAWS